MVKLSIQHIVLLIICLFIFNQIMFPQSFLSNAEFQHQLSLSSPLAMGPDSLPNTLPHALPRKLLPDNMSIMETALWGEHGFLRTIGIASPLTPEARKSELALRRTMLTAHQIGGYVTMALLATTVYFGQRVIDGRSDLRNTHTSFVTATMISYGTTAMLSILSPPPLIRRKDDSGTTTIHKTLAWIHFAGMVITPILGSMIGRHQDYYQRAHYHQVSAYITTAAFTASLIVMTF